MTSAAETIPTQRHGAAPPASRPAVAHLAALRGWTLLALAALAFAAILALVLAASRTPGVLELLPADWDRTFRRVLVTHVVFSSLVWCLAILAALVALADGGGRWSRAGLGIAGCGAALLMLPTLAGLGEAVTSDYVPVLDHPIYLAGLALLCIGVALPLLRFVLRLRWRGAGPFESATGIAAVAGIAAFASFAIAAWRLPPDLDALVRYQLLFWGGGHVLQFTYTAMALACWHALAVVAWGAPPLGSRAFRLTVATLLPAVLAGPALMAGLDLLGGSYLILFTELMRWGVAAAPAIVGVAVAALARRRSLGHPAAVALILSVALFGIGGLAGFFAVGGDTRTPGHYHASLSAVNIALMGLVWCKVLPLVGRAAGTPRLARLQLWSFGLGQALFAIGMFVAGLQGVPRKTSGSAQGLETAVETAAMVLAGLGGLLAVISALVLVAVAAPRLCRRAA